MLRNCHNYLIVILVVFIIFGQNSVNAEEFGRFFTAPKQRQQLDELRRAEPDVVVEIRDEEINLQEEETVEKIQLNTISVKGLVYRNDGKNTAWVNESNSYEGDLSSQYTKVLENKIEQDKISVELPDNKTDIILKVGNSYEPSTGRVLDIVKPQTPSIE